MAALFRLWSAPLRVLGGLALAGLLTLSPAHAADFELVSAEQVRADQAAGNAMAAPAEATAPRTRSLSLAPRIKVLSPRLEGEGLRAPLRIELQFEPVGEAKVNPASLKVLYGFLGIDLTDKIRSNATVTEKGVLAEQARIPAGSHKLRILVTDSLGRTGETEIKFKVEG